MEPGDARQAANFTATADVIDVGDAAVLLQTSNALHVGKRLSTLPADDGIKKFCLSHAETSAGDATVDPAVAKAGVTFHTRLP